MAQSLASTGDLDDLLNSLNHEEVSRKSVASVRAPSTRASTSVNDASIDALLAEMESPTSLPPAPPSVAASSPDVRQSGRSRVSTQVAVDLDTLISDLGATKASPKPSARRSVVPPQQDDLDRLIEDASNKEAAAAKDFRTSILVAQKPDGNNPRFRSKTIGQLEDILADLPGGSGDDDVPLASAAASTTTTAPRAYPPSDPLADDFLAPRSALAAPDPPVITAAQPTKLVTNQSRQPVAQQAENPAHIGSQLVQEFNFLRTQPQRFADWLERERRPFFKDKRLVCPGWTQFLPTAEGIKAVDDAITALRAQKPVPALQEWPGMSAAAAAAVADSGSKGLMKKQDSLGRLADHGVDPAGNRVVELLGFGVCNARELCARLVVGDGDPDRYDRKALLDPEFRFVGVAYGEHKSQFKRMLCVNLAEGFLGAPEPLDYPQYDARLPNREEGDFTNLSSTRVDSQWPKPQTAEPVRDIPPASTLRQFEDALNRFNDAVKDRAARDAFQEAGKLPELMKKWTTDDPNAIGALNDALDRLRKNLKALLGATKDCLQAPAKNGPEDRLFDKLSDELRNQARVADALSRGDLTVLDTINTQLARSGMIEAAAAAARHLQDTFKDNH